MRILATQIVIGLLCIFSITITVVVWIDAGNTTLEKLLLSMAAMALEVSKYVLVPSALMLWQGEKTKPLAALCGLLMVCVVFISVGSMVTFFDSLVSHQKAIVTTQVQTDGIALRITEQRLAANDVIIKASGKLVDMKYLSKGSDKAQNITNIEAPKPERITQSFYAQSLPDDPTTRKTMLAIIGVGIDAICLALISTLFFTSNPLTKKQQSRFNNHPLSDVYESIINSPKDVPLNISEIELKHDVTRRKIDDLVSQMYDDGELRKQSNRYYLNG